MKFNAWTVLIYALLIFMGGIMGHIKAQSTVSLIMGVSFAIGLGLGAWLMFKSNKAGYFLSLLLTLTLGAFFAYRYSLTQSFMPAGLMCILSALVLIILIASRFSCCKK